MKLISINTLKIGEMLSSDIRGSNGNMLLKSRTVLTDKMIEQLKRVGIYSVYVEDDMYDDVIIRPPLSDETKVRILTGLGSIYGSIRKGLKFDINTVKNLAREIFEEVRIAALEPINMISTFAVDSPMLLHSINVAVVTAMLTAKMQIRPQLAENYVLAALTHDMCLDSLDNDNDYQHCADIYNALKATANIDATCYMAATMHHEYVNGKGGPRKLSGTDINEGARLIAVADMYDNVVFGYAGYKRLPLYQAVEYLSSQVNTILDSTVFDVFQKNISIYPNGATVTLNGGQNAVVVKQNMGIPTRPILRALTTNTHDRCEIDMVKNASVFIESVDL